MKACWEWCNMFGAAGTREEVCICVVEEAEHLAMRVGREQSVCMRWVVPDMRMMGGNRVMSVGVSHGGMAVRGTV